MVAKVTLNLQNSQFFIDFYRIELEGCDAVLGAQWLRTLGPIVWKFGNMEMGFNFGGKEIKLIGLRQREAKQIGSRSVSRTLQKDNGKGMLL